MEIINRFNEISWLSEVDISSLNPHTMFYKILTAKRTLIKAGFIHQLALYGLITDTRDESSHYVRVDVLSDTSFTQESFLRVYDFINYIKPNTKYSVWAYSDETKEIKEVLYFEYES